MQSRILLLTSVKLAVPQLVHIHQGIPLLLLDSRFDVAKALRTCIMLAAKDTALPMACLVATAEALNRLVQERDISVPLVTSKL